MTDATIPMGDRAVHRTTGRSLRKVANRSAHGSWEPSADRPDPIEVLRAQDAVRVPELVPIRYGRMAASPFAFFRGAAAVMAADLADTPVTGIEVQAPLFIKTGEKIKVDTRSGKYMERA